MAAPVECANDNGPGRRRTHLLTIRTAGEETDAQTRHHEPGRTDNPQRNTGARVKTHTHAAMLPGRTHKRKCALTPTHTHTHAHTRTHTHTIMHVHTHTHTHTHIQQTHTHTHTHDHACANTKQTHTHIQTHTHDHACANTKQTHTHTHTRRHAPQACLQDSEGGAAK